MHLGRSTKNFRLHESNRSWIRIDPLALEENGLALDELQTNVIRDIEVARTLNL